MAERVTANRRRLTGGLLRIARTLVLAFLGYSALLFFLQRAMVFPGRFMDPPRAEAMAPTGAEQVWIETSFGRVEGWVFPATASQPGPALIFCHANGELMDDWVASMRGMAEMGLTVLLVEYPGYGFSDGKPSRAALGETFRNAYDVFVDRPDVDADRLAIWGRSLGGGVAGDLVLERPAAALILQSTFSSTATLAWQSFYAPGFLVRDKFDNRKAVEGFQGPILLMHGRTDEVIPFSHAVTLAGLRDDLEIAELNCGHNNCSGEWGVIREHARRFLEEQGMLPSRHSGTDDPAGLRP